MLRENARSPDEPVVYPAPGYDRRLYPPLLLIGIRRLGAEYRDPLSGRLYPPLLY